MHARVFQLAKMALVLVAAWTSTLQLLLQSSSLVTAESEFYGYVRFYNHPMFVESGGQYYYYIADAQYCINLSCYDNKASSVKWVDLVEDGDVDGDGKAKIAFFSGKDCTGTKREWAIKDEGFPEDLAKDGIDNDISSFIIYADSRKKKGSVLPCPWGSDLF